MNKNKFLTAEWRNLAMLNYEIDPDILLPYVPPGTELDSWQGKTLISVVGFLFLNTKIKGVPVPFHTDFEEVNLRFYVRRQVEGEWRRGVVFIKEIVPKTAIATVAQTIYNENYVALPMRHIIEQKLTPSGKEYTTVEYGWKFNQRWNQLWLTVSGDPIPLTPDSEEAFITEHYWGYVTQKDGSCLEYEVEHPPWRVWKADDSALVCDIAELYGEEFTEALQARPSSTLLAEGSPVIVYQGTKVGEEAIH